VVALACPLAAQWLHLPTKGVPRTPDGQPDLSAPAPKTADGKPDLTGMWQGSPKYLSNLAADLQPEDLAMQPWAAAVFKERASLAHAREESNANCLPEGVPRVNSTPYPFKILQSSTSVIILYEASGFFRQIFTDGRELPADPNPSWLGYSVGKWQGDTLVVDTTGFNGKTWLDQMGHPQTEAGRVTERFRRPDFGHMELQITIDDPKAYDKKWTVTELPRFIADTELLEFVCNENEKDVAHLKGK
jgi:hypothetical protein